MRVVIDIDEKVYYRVRSLEPRKDGVMLLDTLMCAVQDGTVLPEQHGRLVDMNLLCEDLIKRWDIADVAKEEMIKAIMAEIVTPIIVSQPTILEGTVKG